MPTYEYVCRECGHHLEVVQKFTDAPLHTCERCQGALRKVFSAAGIIFKGSGYYVTDTRSGNGKGAPSRANESSSEGSSETSDSSSDSSGSSATTSSDSKSDSRSGGESKSA